MIVCKKLWGVKQEYIYFYIKEFRIAFPEETVSNAREYQSQCEAVMLKTYFSFNFSASVFKILIKVESLEVTHKIMNAVNVQLLGSTLNKGTIYKLFIDIYFMINRWSLVLQLIVKHIQIVSVNS